MHLSGLVVYPIKSCAGVPVTEWPVDPGGLRYDRSYMVVDGEGRFLTQREFPRLALVRPRSDGDSWILDVDGVECQVPVEPSPGAERTVVVWDHVGPAIDAGDTAASALSELLGVAVRLVALSPQHRRRVDPGFGADDVTVGFVDAFPVLLTTESSLADLDARMPAPLPMTRFRPNLVIAGSPAWAEDGWRDVTVADVSVELVKPCSRCAITTVDPSRGVRDGGEPLRTLGTFRRGDRGVLFGWNGVPRSVGIVSVGDQVTATSR